MIIKFGNRIALIDKEDYHKVTSFGTWYAKSRMHVEKEHHKTYYIVSAPNGNKHKKFTTLHQIILGFFPYLPKGKVIHHKNGKGWDCRKRNLEVTTRSQHLKDHKLENPTGYKRGLSYKNRGLSENRLGLTPFGDDE